MKFVNPYWKYVRYAAGVFIVTIFFAAHFIPDRPCGEPETLPFKIIIGWLTASIGILALDAICTTHKQYPAIRATGAAKFVYYLENSDTGERMELGSSPSLTEEQKKQYDAAPERWLLVYDKLVTYREMP